MRIVNVCAGCRVERGPAALDVFCANHPLQRGARDDDVDGIVDKLAVVVVARSVATMNHAATPLSSAESIFILRAVEEGLRVDGRKRLEQRPVAIAFGAESSASGSVQVRMGTTKVLAVATAELVAPYADRPTEGVLQFFVELSPMASPAFEPGRPSEAAIELMRLLERALRKSQAIDVESLCVVNAKHVWSVRCDVTVLDDGGNLADAALLAALAALRHLRLPAVRVDGTGDEASVRILTEEQGERQPLVFHHTPVSVSLGFLPPSDGGGGRGTCILDPTEREELVMVSRLTVVLNQHQELCALHKPGGVPVDSSELMEGMRSAAEVAPQHLLLLEKVLAEHAQRLAEAAEVLRRTGRVQQKAAAAAAAAAGASGDDGAATTAGPLLTAAAERGEPSGPPAEAEEAAAPSGGKGKMKKRKASS